MLLDAALVQRIHDAQIAGFRELARAVERVRPDAVWKELGGGLALFAGEGSPLTQIIEFGFQNEDASVEEMIDFYSGRCEDWEVAVNPFTHRIVLKRLGDAGFRVTEFDSVLARIAGPMEVPGDLEIEVVEGDRTEWMLTMDQGFSGADNPPPEPSEIARAMANVDCARHYLVRVEGRPAGGASLMQIGDVAHIAGASTLKHFRGLGIQSALLARRLSDAAPGSLALMGATTGSVSHRNTQRSGFETLYNKVVLKRR